ncbi:winged helix-turn-helix domain-containing protein [Enterococcus sp. LJL120]
MGPIAILTNNTLAESELEQKLRKLGYEVFCSSVLFKQLFYQADLFATFFKIVMFSETISDLDVKKSLDYLPKNISTYRITDTVLDEEHEDLIGSESGISQVIRSDMLITELREILVNHSLSIETNQLTDISKKGFVNNLSPKERKLLGLLDEANGQPVSRTFASECIWGKETSPSTLTQLSQLVSRLKNKMAHFGLNENALQVEWGKGYVLNPDWPKRIF